MAGALDAGEFLNIEMHEFAWSGALVAAQRIASRLGPRSSISLSINSSLISSLFFFVIFLFFQVMTHTQTFGHPPGMESAPG